MTAATKKQQNTAIQTKALAIGSSMLALEPRYVFDAAIATELHDVSNVALDAHDSTPASHETGASIVAAANELASISESHDGAHLAARETAVDRTIEALVAAHNLAPSNHEIAFIDSRLADIGTLVKSVTEGTRIVIIDGARDGVAQMVDALKGEQGITGLHILSHGSAGNLVLGSSSINADTMSTIYRSALASIGGNLSADADILVYGCNFGSGDAGARATQMLADLTGADVADSTNLTGNANRGGDWVLERTAGLIEARTIDAPEWNDTMAPLVVSTTAQPTVTGTGNVGTTAVWANAGLIGSTAIDLRASVVAFTPGFAGATTPFFGTVGDNPYVQLTQQSTITLRWEIFAAGTSQSVVAFGTPNWTIKDIDGIGGVPDTRESVAPDIHNLQYYKTESVTNVVISSTNGTIKAAGTQDQASEPNSAVTFGWSDVKSFEVTYRLWIKDPLIQARFEHDGNGDFAFVSPTTTNLLKLDLDGDNSTASGTAFQTTYTEHAASVPVVDGDTTITQLSALGSTLDGATLVLTNAKAGDVLTVDPLPAGMGAIVDTAVSGQITVTLSGAATVADYQAALHAVRFSSTSGAPDTTDRSFAVTVKNDTFGTLSNSAIATIHVTPVNDAPVATNDRGSGTAHQPITVAVLGNDSDVDGTLVASSVKITGTTNPGDSLVVPGEGTWSVNTTTGAITFTALPAFSGAPTPITYTVADNSGVRSNAATVSVMPLINEPHLDLSGQTPHVNVAGQTPVWGAITYPHNGGYGANPAWASPAGLDRFSAVSAEAGGPGLALSNDGSSGHVTGVASTTLAESIAQGEYITMSFTTKGAIPETWIQETALRISGGQFKFAFAISTDGFQSATLLSKDNLANTFTGNIYDGNASYSLAAATDYQLQPNTTYELRAYI